VPYLSTSLNEHIWNRSDLPNSLRPKYIWSAQEKDVLGVQVYEAVCIY
jgi:hypothetical protein